MGNPELKTIPNELLVDLVARARQGEEAAFSQLVSLTKNRLFRFLVFLARDSALAHDLCQETYLYAFEHLKDLDETRAFPRWLFLVAKNRFLDHRRSPRNRPYEDVEKADALESASGDRELAVQTREVLAQLPEDDRLVLLLVDLEGQSYAEAAVIIGISESALRSRLHRAREAFHKIFFKG